jgi:hypothetical protein
LKTNSKHFQKFKEEAKWWIEFFGLKTWDIDFEHTNLEEADAECQYDVVNRYATIRLNKDVTESDIRKLAFHEVVETLLADFFEAAIQRSSSEEEIDFAKHNVIHILENTIYKELRQKKHTS